MAGLNQEAQISKYVANSLGIRWEFVLILTSFGINGIEVQK